MKYLLYNILIAVILIGCQKEDYFFDEHYYQTDFNSWKKYFNEIGINEIIPGETVIIIVDSNICQPCIHELQNWKNINKEDKIDIRMVVIEKHKRIFDLLLSKLNLNFETHQDDSGLVFEYDLIPQVPIKIFFNRHSELEMVYPVGTGGEFNSFLEKMKSYQA